MILISVNVLAGNLKAYFTYCTFNTPESGPFIETYLSVVGNSAVYSKTNANTFQSKIEITLIFKQGDMKHIVQFHTYYLYLLKNKHNRPFPSRYPSYFL